MGSVPARVRYHEVFAMVSRRMNRVRTRCAVPSVADYASKNSGAHCDSGTGCRSLVYREIGLPCYHLIVHTRLPIWVDISAYNALEHVSMNRAAPIMSAGQMHQ